MAVPAKDEQGRVVAVLQAANRVSHASASRSGGPPAFDDDDAAAAHSLADDVGAALHRCARDCDMQRQLQAAVIQVGSLRAEIDSAKEDVALQQRHAKRLVQVGHEGAELLAGEYVVLHVWHWRWRWRC